MRRLTGRRRRRRWPRFGRPRSLTAALLALGAAIAVVLAVWAALDVRSARHDLLEARLELLRSSELVQAGDATVATNLHQAARDAVHRTNRAHARLSRDPALRLASFVPGLKTQRDGLLGAVSEARQAATIGERLTATLLAQQDVFTLRNSAVNLAAMNAVADAATSAGHDLAALPKSHRSAQWFVIGHATRDLDHSVANTAHRLTSVAATLRVARGFLGGDGPRRVFIAIENNAEMRDQGMVLSYAVGESSNGTFHVTRSGSVADLGLNSPVGDVKLPSGTQAVFGSLAPTRLWQSVNASADTALAGETMRSMYRAATGQLVDGTIALDVPALASLLAVTGPVNVTGINEPITAKNAARVLLHDLYAQADSSGAGREARQQQLAEVATAVIGRLESGAVNATAFIGSLGGAASGGHVAVTSSRPDEQRALEHAGLSGPAGRVGADRTVHIAVQNGTANKLDWFVNPVVNLQISVTPDGTAVVKAEVTVPNSAPVPTPESEQFGPDHIVTDVAGLYRARVYFWGPSDGDQLNSVLESRLRLNFVTADVPAGGTKTVTLSTAIANAVKHGVLRLRLVPQPRVRPIKLRVTVNALGWRVKGAPTMSLDWGRTLEVSFRLAKKR